MVPRVGYLYPIGKGKKRASVKGPMRIWDEATRSLLLPYCEETGEPGLEIPAISRDGRFVKAEPPSDRSEGGNGRRPKRSQAAPSTQ